MKLLSRPSLRSLVVVAALVAILMVLAVLQYRWSGQVSEAERARMTSNLDTVVSQFRREFNFELQRLCRAFPISNANISARNWQNYAERYDNWLQTAAESRLIANLFLWDIQATPPGQLLHLDRDRKEFMAIPWPERLEDISTHAPLASPARLPMEFRLGPWILLEDHFLLLHPLQQFSAADRRPGGSPEIIAYFMIELDQATFFGGLIHELAQRYFGADEDFLYQIAIVDEFHGDKVLYRSGPDLAPEFFSTPDVRIPLLLELRDLFSRGGREREDRLPSGPEGPGIDGKRQREFLTPQIPPAPRTARGRFSLAILAGSQNVRWMLLARHHAGTLGEVVAKQRFRNLGIGFGILMLLALSMAMIMVSTQRARRLAELQIKFVAGVSHELRTPLAVICAAGDNLASGVVTDSSSQVRQYGELVRQEGRRLTEMVERILQYAGTRQSERKYNLRPARIAEVVESTLATVQPMIDLAGFTVEMQIEPDLAPVKIDKEVLSHCLENLISNALKFGDAGRWLGIRARNASSGNCPEVQISVEDRGGGIDPGDLPHIFDPFYRGSVAVESNIRGSGLGLSLAREGIAGMGGSISVKSEPGKGSVFTMHLPAFQPVEAADPTRSQA